MVAKRRMPEYQEIAQRHLDFTNKLCASGKHYIECWHPTDIAWEFYNWHTAFCIPIPPLEAGGDARASASSSSVEASGDAREIWVPPYDPHSREIYCAARITNWTKWRWDRYEQFETYEKSSWFEHCTREQYQNWYNNRKAHMESLPSGWICQNRVSLTKEYHNKHAKDFWSFVIVATQSSFIVLNVPRSL